MCLFILIRYFRLPWQFVLISLLCSVKWFNKREDSFIVISPVLLAVTIELNTNWPKILAQIRSLKFYKIIDPVSFFLLKEQLKFKKRVL